MEARGDGRGPCSRPAAYSSTPVGRLRKTDDGATWELATRTILGRSRACAIRLADAAISGEHAVLRWTGADWQIQDLHSRNGVHVDGRRLGSDERVAVAAGATIGLGRRDGYVLIDASPPVAFATPLAGPQAPVLAVGGVLTLPGADGPTAMILRGPGGWCLELVGDDPREVRDGDVLEIAGRAFRLSLPEALAPTIESHAAAPRLGDLHLRFTVSRDEEYVELVAVHGDRTLDFKARSHHYPLLLLARARLDQRERPPDEQGWIDQETLLEMLRVDRNQLHLDVFRLRRQLGDAGIGDASQIVERRPGTRMLRIGVERLEIAVLGERG